LFCHNFSRRNYASIKNGSYRRDATFADCGASTVDDNTLENRNSTVLLAYSHAGLIDSRDGGKIIGEQLHTLQRKYCTCTASQNCNPLGRTSNPAWMKFSFRDSPASPNVRIVADETLWKRAKRPPEVRQVFGTLSS